MNARQKFLNTVNFERKTSALDWEFCYWYDTIDRWYSEGMPKKNPPRRFPNCQWVPGQACVAADDFTSDDYYDHDTAEFFSFDQRARCVGVSMSPMPAYEYQVLEEDMENITFLAYDGKVMKTRKDGSSMPQYLKYPVVCERDFDQIADRFSYTTPGRFSANWDSLVADYQKRTYPLQLGGGAFSGFYSVLREMMGVEGTSFAFYDQPQLIKRILNHFLEFYTELYSRVLRDVEVDYVLIWEDLSYKNGPLVSPDLFRKWIYPCYRELIGRMKDLGVKHFFVDTDGNFDVLLEMFTDAGVTGFYPFEVNAGMDVEKIRCNYPELTIMGTIDKTALAAGREAIDLELEKAKRLLSCGGYIPYTDHMVPPEVSFENYCYFRNRLKDLLKC